MVDPRVSASGSSQASAAETLRTASQRRGWMQAFCHEIEMPRQEKGERQAEVWSTAKTSDPSCQNRRSRFLKPSPKYLLSYRVNTFKLAI
ncbi:hypothetical protein STEG23_007206 [Scotinomys teguina]